ncbi:hypothetical protein CsSME_00051032 [Camellia sinensis var. sinensis]
MVVAVVGGGEREVNFGAYWHYKKNKMLPRHEGVMLNVAGGFTLEHPLTLPFVDTMVGPTDFVMGLPKSLTEKLIQEAL